MFSNIGWGELLIIMAAALIVLGPERLPGAMSWTLRAVRQVRDYATGATSQLKDELGPEFEDLRKPLSQLNELRGMTPQSLVTKHLLNGDSSAFDDVKKSFDLGEAPGFGPSKKQPPPYLNKTDLNKGPDLSKGPKAPGGPHDASRWDAT
ncbi:Sec-independent protein translocase subunit TatB [Gordonia amarae]|uniref:Sec-independent protein translocase protein TatB n=2 Tax=Gordonia amarae TaxID=36821 RepID=G7GRB2_9ACTN|nr:Sec-independent protein translocase protein TatB [Gordonia amarae]MCS3878371.1 sec-independent protein translocase protein TatB [Gordonia amarae]QHN17008.1 Sec-independent protein translocase subunit TatB [Gordonia amarae]QHN21534.1 Sec-independent protein translocase subunit TatB [Gordonia amarae]QHN30384.1 Sec-independent protein translocase subunit TatB [Gordonia amarae]QHN39161.1 Sec-independent protein translocase subunit TatB [Gordonia amarae]